MKRCLPDGDLRAFRDGELPEAGGHLEICAGCSARYRELSARADRVSRLMAILGETTPARLVPVRATRGKQWAVAALSMAAALALGFVALPKQHAPSLPVAKEPALAAAPLRQMEKPLAAASRPVPRREPARPAVLHADFLRLDDEPLETGTVVRVSAQDGDVQADLIIGPDGRAHAIRVVSNQ